MCFALPQVYWGRIELFSERDMEGDFLHLEADTPELTLKGFNDHAKSMRVLGMPWVVFDDINYQGDFKLYKPGEYNSIPGFEDKISSVRMVQGSLDNALIQLYENINYGGRELVLQKNAEDLRTFGFNDRISSHKVRRGAWVLYEDVQYQGKKMVALAGDEVVDYVRLRWNDKVSSVQIMKPVTDEESQPARLP